MNSKFTYSCEPQTLFLIYPNEQSYSETLLDKLRGPVFISTYESSIKKRHDSLGIRNKIRETTIQFCAVPLIYRGLLVPFVIVYDMVY